MLKTHTKRRFFRGLASSFALRSAFTLVTITAIEGCKPKDETTTTSTGASATSTGGAPAVKRAAVPADVCSLLSAADVGVVLGEKVESKEVPGGGCQFPGGTRKSLYPTVSVAEDVAGAGGIEGAKTGAQGTVGGVTSPLTVNGASGYVVTGKIMNSTSTQAAVATKGLIVTVTLAGGEKATNEKIAADILKLALVKL